eukprot:COSAG01_NODE_1130_length_11575_cov_6.349773_14_plen_312_part_00
MCGGKDDGSECFCRCCCEHKNAGFQCRWKGGPPPPPSPPPPPPPLPPPPPPQPCTTDQQLTIKEYGQSTQIWVKSAGKTNKGISVSGSNLTMEHGPRAYLTSECTSSVGPSTFAKMLWNASKTLSYTVDLSKVGCGCNAALYLVAMPYHDKDACGDYYCDANFPHCHCPEMDIQEANTHAWQATPHKCSGTKGAYTSCDKGGCGKHFTGSDYGPGKTIDTTLPFEVSVTLQPTSVVKLRQGAHTASVHDPCAVNAEALRDGMVVAISNWGGAGGGMSWLDGQHCSPSTQCNNGAATWSDLRMCAAGHDFCE